MLRLWQLLIAALGVLFDLRWLKFLKVKKIKHTKRYDQLKNCEESLMSAKYENPTATMSWVKRQQSLNKG